MITGLSRVRTRGISLSVQKLLTHLVQQGYSRDQEFRADRFAVALTKAAGFDPDGGCRLFTMLGAQNKDDSASVLGSYFASHPTLSDRIERINRRVQEL